jgi:hypothetical protein
MNVLTFPGTPGENAFYRELEQWLHTTFDGTWGSARTEWTKCWAFSDRAAWSDPDMLTRTIPAAVNAGRPADGDLNCTLRTLDALDPESVYTNDFLSSFAPQQRGASTHRRRRWRE